MQATVTSPMAARQPSSDVIEFHIRKNNLLTATVALLTATILILLAFRISPRQDDTWFMTPTDRTHDLMKLGDTTDNSDGNFSLLTPPTNETDNRTADGNSSLQTLPTIEKKSLIQQLKLNGKLVCNGGPMEMANGGVDTNSAPGYTVTEYNLEHILACISTSKKQLIFTTFLINQDANGLLIDDKTFGMTAFNYNWAKHLEDRAGVSNYMMVSLSEAGCGPSRELGIPCYVNTFEYLEGAVIYKGRQVALKWYYLLRIAELGYDAIFLDNDVATLKNPFFHWNMEYDFQGLSDIISDDGTLPKYLKDSVCGVGYFPWPPCISTGIMFVRCTEPTVDLLKAMVVKLEEKGWEQADFQAVVQPFMVNMGNNPPALRLRVLPLENYHNLGMYDARISHKKYMSTIMAHCGYIGGEDKRKELEKHGFWILRPDP